MNYRIRGTDMQVVDMQINQGEEVFTEAGGMSWMSGNIDMNAQMDGGFFKGIGRMVSGESLFMTHYTCSSGTGVVTFASEFPGKIIPMELQPGQSIICQRDAFMAAEKGVELKMEFRKKLGAGLFGGEGFILQRITGPGKAFFEIDGDVTVYDLNAGQVLKIDPGHIAAFEPTINYDITRVKGVKNILFGGEGMFLAQVTGPGKVWLQSMPIANLAGKISRYMPSGGGSSNGGGSGVLNMLVRN